MNKEKEIFFTADTHFFHNNILKYTRRLEFLNNEEKNVLNNGSEEDIKKLKISDESTFKMNEKLIENWNSVVGKEDKVYFLGDFALKCNAKDAKNIRDQLNGLLYFIEGNHDSVAEQIKNSFECYEKFKEIRVKDDNYPNKIQHITLCHYAMKVWNNSHRGSFSLYGHTHHRLPDDPNSLSIDVGVDGFNYTPISYKQVKQIMSKKCLS